MTCQPASTSYRNPKDSINKHLYQKDQENDSENQFTDSVISNPLFDEIFTDFNAKERYDFSIESNDGKRGTSLVRSREEENDYEYVHANKKRKVINNASDMLLEVRESYAFVQGADIYDDSSQQFFNSLPNQSSNQEYISTNFTNNQVSSESLQQNSDLNYPYRLNDKWNGQVDLSVGDVDKCSSSQSGPSCSPDQAEAGLQNPPPSPQKTPTNFQTYDYQDNSFNPALPFQNANIKVEKPYTPQLPSTSPVKPQPPLYPEPNMCHLLHNKSPGFLAHPLYNLLKDLVIADMNFSNPSFPFDLILHLPETFERLLHNYFTRNPGISLAHVHPVAHPIILDSLRQAHNSLIC